MIRWRYGADAGVVDSDVGYMLVDSSNDAVRIQVVQTDQPSSPTSRNDLDSTAAQSPTGQPAFSL